MTAGDPTVVADRYVLQTQLRLDPGSVTWLANDLVLDRRVELELTRPEVADDPDVVAAIDSATRALARCDTTVVLGLLDAGVQDGLPFLVTEHAPGTTFDRILRERGPIDPDEAVDVGVQVLKGLAETHDAGIAHLDVRPATVVRAEDAIRLRAPGTAQALVRAHGAAAPDRDGRALPPEATDGRVDRRTDVWCVGALLYELLTGRAPRYAARFVRAERADVSRALDAVIARALAPDAIDRYPDVSSMRAALERLNDGSVPVAEDETPRDRRGVFRTWLAVPMLVVVIALAGVGAGIWLGRLELGGPVGIRVPDEESPSVTAAEPSVLAVAAVSAFDPLGDGEENSDNAALAVDGDRTTVWRSENYFDGELHKDGVGLLLDLGDSVDVGSVRLWTPSPGFSFSVRIGDDADALVEAADAGAQASTETRVQFDDAHGRYVLIWATSVVPTVDGNRIEIAEVRVLGSGA